MGWRVVASGVVAAVVLVGAGMGVSQAADIPRAGVGFRYDGSGVYPNDWKPPVAWDEASGQGVRWKIETPNWGYGCPIEVGDKVFFVSEPGTPDIPWPLLVCVSADTGKELWRTSINPLLAYGIDDAERARLTEEWAFVLDTWRFAYAAARDLPQADSNQLVRIQASFKERGFDMGGYKHGYGLLRQFKPQNNPRYAAATKALGKYGVRVCTWQAFSKERVGMAFPTPVSDGEAIYVFDHFGTVARVMMDGKIGWIINGKQSAGQHNGLGASPRLCGDRLFTYNGGMAAAWDKHTGRQVWRAGVDTPKQHSHGDYTSPVLMDIGGVEVWISPRGEVYRVEDGNLLLSDLGGQVTYGNYAYDDARDTIYFSFTADNSKGHFYARRLVAGADGWKSEEVFTRERGLNPLSPVFVDGRIYHQGLILNTTNGLPHKECDPRSLRHCNYDAAASRIQAPLSHHLMLAAGGRVYGFDAGWLPKGTNTALVTVYDLEGKSLGWNTVTQPSPEDPAMQKVIAQGIDAGSFSYSCSFSLGRSALYLRSPSHLWCFGSQ
jgi:hypothetical protein